VLNTRVFTGVTLGATVLLNACGLSPPLYSSVPMMPVAKLATNPSAGQGKEAVSAAPVAPVETGESPSGRYAAVDASADPFPSPSPSPSARPPDPETQDRSPSQTHRHDAPDPAASVRIDPESAGLVRTEKHPRHRQNVLTLGTSNYQVTLRNYRVLQKKILDFPSDSLQLSANYRHYLWLVANRFNPESDLVSVVGCSNGPTAVAGGNSTLASGRATRVEQLLIHNGIPPQAILTEACWSNRLDRDDFPNRGAIVTLLRRW